jgi:hypothetical protein
MKAARWCTGVGSVLLFLVSIGHGVRIRDINTLIQTAGWNGPLAQIVRACWLVFSGEMMALAVIAFLASTMERGGRFVLICAATMAADGALAFHYSGWSPPVYISAVIALIFLAGGWLQVKSEA